MISDYFASLWHSTQYIPLWSALSATRLRSLDHRARIFGQMVGFVMRWFPPARWRFDKEVLRVFPDMPRRQRAALSREMGRNMGRNLLDILRAPKFQSRPHRFHVSGPGLATLERALAAGKGAIIVSGHFGHYLCRR